MKKTPLFVFSVSDTSTKLPTGDHVIDFVANLAAKLDRMSYPDTSQHAAKIHQRIIQNYTSVDPKHTEKYTTGIL